MSIEGEVLNKLIGLVNYILTINRIAKFLKAFYDKAIKNNFNLEIEDRLLLY